MTDILAVEAAEIAGEQQPSDRGLSSNTYLSLISSMVTDSQQFIQNDVSPDRVTAQHMYQGGTNIERPNDQRSGFVMREVRDAVEQVTPAIIKIFTGAEYLVSFQARDVNEAAQSAASDATEAFHDIFFNQNDGWLLLQGMTRDALKAKTGILKVFVKEEIRVKQVEWQGSAQEFELIAARDDVDVAEVRSEVMVVQEPIPITGQVIQRGVEMVDATLIVKAKEARIAIEATAPEEFLINRSATSTEFGYYNLIGERSVKTVTDAVQMGIDYDTAVKWSGTGDGSATGDYPDQERRARRDLSRDPMQEQVHHDPAMQPLTIYEIYVRVDRDQDGIAELRRVIALGEDVGEIVEDEIVEDHPYCVASAIPVEHSVIGESMADNLSDLQDIMTQLYRNALDNMGYVNNPRPIYGNGVNLEHLLDNRLGFPISGTPGNIEFLKWPSIIGELIPLIELINQVKQSRTGISDESQGLNAKNLQASSEVGVLAILGAGLTQPELIAANLAHSAIKPCAQKVVSLLKAMDAPQDILSMGSGQEVNPRMWPDNMGIKVRVGLGTGTRDEKLASLYQLKKTQEQILLQAGPDNPWVKPEQYARTNHEIGKLSNLGQTTEYLQSPEEVQQYVAQKAQQAAMTPPQPSEDMQKEMLKSETTLKKQRMADETDILQTVMDNEAKREEVYLEAELSREQGSEVDLGG